MSLYSSAISFPSAPGTIVLCHQIHLHQKNHAFAVQLLLLLCHNLLLLPQILLLHQINLATAVQLHQVSSCSPLPPLPSQAPLPSWRLRE